MSTRPVGQKMRDIETMKEDGRFEMLTKKEQLGELDRDHEGLMRKNRRASAI